MANLGQKGGVFRARFRLGGKEYKKSLKTRDESAAKAALHLIDLTLHRLHTGQLRAPVGVDPAPSSRPPDPPRRPTPRRPSRPPGR